MVPTGTRPCTPCSICQFTILTRAALSICPSLNGVISAVFTPLNGSSGIIPAIMISFFKWIGSSIIFDENITKCMIKQGHNRFSHRPQDISAL